MFLLSTLGTFSGEALGLSGDTVTYAGGGDGRFPPLQEEEPFIRPVTAGDLLTERQ